MISDGVTGAQCKVGPCNTSQIYLGGKAAIIALSPASSLFQVTIHPPPTMSEYSYPHELYQAAKLYPMSSTAYANLRPAHNHISLRIQAPEIMMQFVGDVDLGKGTPRHCLGIV